MTKSPEQIWVDYAPYTESYERVSDTDEGGYTNYIRKDIHTEEIKRLKEKVEDLQVNLATALVREAATTARYDNRLAKADALSAALDWAYTGDGLDECALKLEAITVPFSNPTKPNHAFQVGVRLLIAEITARAKK